MKGTVLGRWSALLSVMTSLAFADEASDSRREIIGKLSGYPEFFSSVRTEDGVSWIGTVDLGLTYAVAESLRVDSGCNVGVTGAPDHVNVFTGISVRF